MMAVLENLNGGRKPESLYDLDKDDALEGLRRKTNQIVNGDKGNILHNFITLIFRNDKNGHPQCSIVSNCPPREQLVILKNYLQQCEEALDNDRGKQEVGNKAVR